MNCGSVAYSGLNVSVDFSKEVQDDEIPDILTSAQATRYFSITYDELYRGVRNGYLHPTKQNGRRSFDRSEIESYQRILEDYIQSDATRSGGHQLYQQEPIS